MLVRRSYRSSYWDHEKGRQVKQYARTPGRATQVLGELFMQTYAAGAGQARGIIADRENKRLERIEAQTAIFREMRSAAAREDYAGGSQS
jgi:hypothetical protein